MIALAQQAVSVQARGVAAALAPPGLEAAAKPEQPPADTEGGLELHRGGQPGQGDGDRQGPRRLGGAKHRPAQDPDLFGGGPVDAHLAPGEGHGAPADGQAPGLQPDPFPVSDRQAPDREGAQRVARKPLDLQASQTAGGQAVRDGLQQGQAPLRPQGEGRCGHEPHEDQDNPAQHDQQAAQREPPPGRCRCGRISLRGQKLCPMLT